MRDLLRAWRSFATRPASARARLVRELARHALENGLRSALARVRRAGAATASTDDWYTRWLAAHTPDAAALAAMHGEIARLAVTPLVSIVTPVHDTEPRWLEACAASVLGQVYERWQWCLCDDGSTRADTRAALADLARRDARIVLTRLDLNAGIAAASNRAIDTAEGDWLALLDSDDVLAPHALFRMVEYLNGPGRDAEVVYSDEDKLDEAGRRCEAYFKPDWSPDLFRSNMYACHLLMARRALVVEAGAFRSAFDYSQDYDLLLRLTERTSRIGHVADVLYHWRRLPQSGAAAGGAKPDAHQAGRRALQDHLRRTSAAGCVQDAGVPGFYRVHYQPPAAARVSLLALEDDARAAARALCDLATASARAGHTAEIAACADEVRGDFVLLVQAPLEPACEAWLDALVHLAAQPGIGIVAPRVVDGAGRILESGLALHRDGRIRWPLRGWPHGHGGYFGSGLTIRNVAAAGPSCLMSTRAVFEAVGGVDSSLAPLARAVDYAVRIRRAGYRVVATPWSVLRSASPVAAASPQLADAEITRLERRWKDAWRQDPFLNPHLRELPADAGVF